MPACAGKLKILHVDSREKPLDIAHPYTSNPEPSKAEPGMVCPNCSAHLHDHGCKLKCPQCGFYLSCSDFY